VSSAETRAGSNRCGGFLLDWRLPSLRWMSGPQRISGEDPSGGPASWSYPASAHPRLTVQLGACKVRFTLPVPRWLQTSESERSRESNQEKSGPYSGDGGRATPPGAGEVTSNGPVARSRIRESGITLTQAERDSQWT